MLESWYNEGFALIHDFFPEKDLKNVTETLKRINFTNTHEFGSKNGVLEFPCDYDDLNYISLHPKLIKYCQKLLGTYDIRLIQSDFWSKTNDGTSKKNSNSDQRIHMDYPNNYLTYPNEWKNPESVAIIIYYSDSELCGGETRIVPRLGNDDPLYQEPYTNIAGLGKYAFNNDKSITEKYFKENYPEIYKFRQKLYLREIPVSFKPGTVLFYRHDIWHRGFPIKFNQTRIVQNLGFKKAGCDWITIWNKGWARGLCDYNKKLERFLEKSSESQRICLGIPSNSSDYWKPIKKKMMKVRYNLSKL